MKKTIKLTFEEFISIGEAVREASEYKKNINWKKSYIKIIKDENNYIKADIYLADNNNSPN